MTDEERYGMTTAQIDGMLEELSEQSYPLSIDQRAATALVACITHIMDAVPDDDRVFVAADYNKSTAALCHPINPRKDETP